MKTFYVIRKGWNAANQSSVSSKRNPKNRFESNLYRLVAVVQAASEEEAIKKSDVNCYNNQTLFATSNPRSVKGLTAEIRGQ